MPDPSRRRRGAHRPEPARPGRPVRGEAEHLAVPLRQVAAGAGAAHRPGQLAVPRSAEGGPGERGQRRQVRRLRPAYRDALVGQPPLRRLGGPQCRRPVVRQVRGHVPGGPVLLVAEREGGADRRRVADVDSRPRVVRRVSGQQHLGRPALGEHPLGPLAAAPGRRPDAADPEGPRPGPRARSPARADDTEQISTPTRSAPRYAPSPTTGRSAAARVQSTSTMAAASAASSGRSRACWQSCTTLVTRSAVSSVTVISASMVADPRSPSVGPHPRLSASGRKPAYCWAARTAA